MSELGVPIDWTVRPRPQRVSLSGERVTLVPLDAEAHAAPLYGASHPPDGDPSIWTYLFDGPFPDLEAFRRDLALKQASADPLFFTVIPVGDGRPQGVASYMRITPDHGVLELGNIWFGPDLQRTAAATEAIFLLARHAFDDLGYRRLEWKCNALNAPSRRAAERFGFRFEGVFAQHMVVKGRNRDTAWYAITDVRWPAIRTAFQAWLDPANFDGAGRQRQSLRALLGEV